MYMNQNVRILEFSPDGAAQNLKAMRHSMNLFSNEKTGFEDHPHVFKISLLKVSELLGYSN